MSVVNRLLVAGLRVVPKPVVGLVAKRYVAGETLDDAVATVKRLQEEGACATLDVLGEEVIRPERAEAARDLYLQVLEAIETHKLDASISVKPTQMGLDFDADLCRRIYEQLVERAAAQQNYVRIDMEDHTVTTATLDLYNHLYQRYGGQHVGAVLQGYMRRTLDDIAALPTEHGNIRLCKGIYIEPRHVAFKDYETVRLNFIAALQALFAKGVFVGIATHDEYLICAAIDLIHRHGLSPDRYEFQMLLGVEDELRRILIAEGHPLRVYVPFGKEWYLYSMRRLRENPQIAGHVARAVLTGK
ncbi:MAG: proline dehydrogenase family protein [Acidobacteriota bacterium]